LHSLTVVLLLIGAAILFLLVLLFAVAVGPVDLYLHAGVVN